MTAPTPRRCSPAGTPQARTGCLAQGSARRSAEPAALAYQPMRGDEAPAAAGAEGGGQGQQEAQGGLSQGAPAERPSGRVVYCVA